jgi:iron complex transport system substrate-binding protein
MNKRLLVTLVFTVAVAACSGTATPSSSDAPISHPSAAASSAATAAASATSAATSVASAPASPTDEPTTAPTLSGSFTPPSKPPTSSEPAVFPRTVTDDEGTEVTLDAQPQRIVSLSPANTEITFALGAGERVVGGTDSDDYPAEAAALPDVVQGITVLTEQIVSLEPDLVLAGGNGFTPAADIQRLRDLKIPVLVLYPQTISAVSDDITLVGQALGEDAAATTAVDGIEARVDEVLDAVDGMDTPKTFYEIGYGPDIYGPAPDSFIADLVSLAGGDPVTTGDPASFSIPLEKLVDDDPQVIVLGDAAYEPRVCPPDVAAREGWGSITAVKDDAIFPVNDLIVTRPGPRIGEGLADLALAIHPDAQIQPSLFPGTELCSAP